MTMCAFTVRPPPHICLAGDIEDYFPAYQSALLTTPLLLLRIFVALLRFPAVLQTLFTLLLVVPSLYMS